MAAQMMHRHQRFVRCQRQPFGKVHAHQRTDEAGGIGHGNGVDFFQRASCVLQCLTHHAGNGFAVTAGGDFRHHATIELMLLHL